MRILILGLNYAPEPVGIGPYTRDMAASFAAAGHVVTVVCGKPYYPTWRVQPDYASQGVLRSREDGVEVLRVPLFVPATPDGRGRILQHLAFAMRAQPALPPPRPATGRTSSSASRPRSSR